MADQKKIGDTVISFTSRRGVHVFRRSFKMPGGKPYVSPRFQMRVLRGGRREYFQLPSTVKEAGIEADKIDAFLDVRSNTLDDAIKLFDPERWALMNPVAKVATVGDVVKAHEAAEKALSLDARTARGYRGAIYIVFREALAASKGVLHQDSTIDTMPMSALTLGLISAFKVARVAQAGEDKAEQERKKRGANGTFRSLLGLFSKEAMRHYSHLTLPPDLLTILGAAKFRKVGKVKKRLPEVAVLRRLFAEVGELRDKDQNAYLAFLLAAHCGLRLKELAWARPDWLQAGETPRMWVHTTEDFKSKSSAERFAEIQPWVFDELQALTKDRTYMLTGKKTVRYEKTAKALNAWVKSRDFAEAGGEKGVHGLRFLFGAYVANRRSLYTAQKFLGHESVTTTEDHYTDLILDESLFALWEKAPEWVKPDAPAPQPAADSPPAVPPTPA